MGSKAARLTSVTDVGTAGSWTESWWALVQPLLTAHHTIQVFHPDTE